MSDTMNKESEPFAWVDWMIAEREKQKLSQADLARKAGLARTTISDYEKRVRPNPSVAALTRIATALGYPEDHLLRLAGMLQAEAEGDPWVEKMAYRLSRLSPGLRDVAERFIDAMLEGEEAAEAPKKKPSRKSAKI